MKNLKWVASVLSVVGLTGLILSVTGLGAPGDVVRQIPVFVPAPYGVGVGIAVDCDGILYYTNTGVPTLHKMDATGVGLGSVPITKSSDGSPVSIGAICWDDTRGMIWGGTDSGSPAKVYLIDPTTGVALFRFNVVSAGVCFIDGVAFDGNDSTVWVSDDVSDVIDHFDAASGQYLGSLTPKDGGGATLGLISGVMVGANSTLYLGRNGLGEIVVVDKTTGDFIGVFAMIGGRDADLECDVINFAPMIVAWSKDAYNDMVTAIELEPGMYYKCLLCDCPHQCDYDNDLFLTAVDLGALIDVLFAGRPEDQDPECPASRGDFDNDGFPTALDLSGLIDHLFAGAEAPCDPCNPVQSTCAK